MYIPGILTSLRGFFVIFQSAIISESLRLIGQCDDFYFHFHFITNTLSRLILRDKHNVALCELTERINSNVWPSQVENIMLKL